MFCGRYQLHTVQQIFFLARQNVLTRPYGVGHSRVCRVRARLCVNCQPRRKEAARDERPVPVCRRTRVNWENAHAVRPARTCTCNAAVRSTRTGDRTEKTTGTRMPLAEWQEQVEARVRKSTGTRCLNRAFALVLSGGFVPSSRNEPLFIYL